MDQKTPIDARRAAALDRLIELMAAAGPVEFVTDKYFSNTRRIVAARGDTEVTYAIFLRRRAIAALEPVARILARFAPEARLKRLYGEGEVVPAERKLMEVSGPMAQLSELETLILQKTGFACVCAENAYEMCLAMPGSSFLDMHARHATGAEMNLLAAYGAAVGSDAARAADGNVRGFVGSSQDLTAPLFGAEAGAGTMPHALVGYTNGDALAALKLFAAEVADADTLVALVDYKGEEISDSLECARWFFEESGLAGKGKRFAVRLDTHGGRFAQGLDYERSIDLVGEWLDVEGEYNIVEQVLGTRAFRLDRDNILVDQVRRLLFGAGVSVASIINTRKALDEAGYGEAMIVASSGFGPQKCLIMGAARAPIDMVGTGSFLPTTLGETYATADIIAYDGKARVKTGREFLLD